MKYECDCGRGFSDPDGPIMCADSHHGQPLKSVESAPSASTNTQSEEIAALRKRIGDLEKRFNDFVMLHEPVEGFDSTDI